MKKQIPSSMVGAPQGQERRPKQRPRPRIWLGLVLLLAVALPLRAEEDFFVQALQAAQGGKVTEAIEFYDKAIERDPEDVLAWYQRAALKINHLGKDSYDDALEDLTEALRIRPKMVLPRIDRALVLWRQGKAEEALASLDEALRIQPASFGALTFQGNILRSLDRNDEAVASYTRMIESYPGHLSHYKLRGTLLARLGKPKEAIADYDIALKSVNGNSPAQDQALILQRVQLHLMLKQPAAAFEDSNRYVRWNPERHEGWEKRASASLLLGKPKEHLDSLDQWLRLEPGNTLPMQLRARAKYRQGQHASALEDALTLVKRTDPRGDHLLLASWLLSSVPKDGLRDGKQALELADKSSGSKKVSGGWVREAKASALAETGDLKGAVQQQEKAIQAYQADLKEQPDRLKHAVSCAEKRLKGYQDGKPNRSICQRGR